MNATESLPEQLSPEMLERPEVANAITRTVGQIAQALPRVRFFIEQLAAIALARAAWTGWIPAEDESPEAGERVLVYRPDAHHPPASDPNIDVREYDGATYHGSHPVTHWMRLPLAPGAVPLLHRWPVVPSWGLTRTGTVRTQDDAQKMALRDFGLKPGDSGAFDFGAGFQRGVVFGRATASLGVPRTVWSKKPPTKQGLYWHWTGDLDARPIPLSVLWSGSTNTCFVSAGQYGITQAIDCDKYGGLWTPVIEPEMDESIGYHGSDA